MYSTMMSNVIKQMNVINNGACYHSHPHTERYDCGISYQCGEVEGKTECK